MVRRVFRFALEVVNHVGIYHLNFLRRIASCSVTLEKPSDGHPTSPSQYHHPQDARLDMEQNTRPLSPRGYGGEQSPPYHQREPPMEGNSEFQNRPPPR